MIRGMRSSRHLHLTAALLATLTVFVLVPVRAQESRAAAPSELQALVDRYLGERDDGAAIRMLDELVRRPDAAPESVRAALAHAGSPLAREMSALVPYRGQMLAATIRVPEGHSRDSARLPVVFDVSGGDIARWLRLEEVAIVAVVKLYTPPEFSDEGRDGFLKVARWTAHLGHGDPQRLWLCGFSWAGHASYDTALHRPGSLRGIVPMGGGPRRTWYRLLQQLAPVRVLAFCGKNDDPELVWNLQELSRLAPSLKLDYALSLDPEQGHQLPLAGMDVVAARVAETPAHDALVAPSGTLLADAALVESPILRVDALDQARVAVPARIPVSATASADEQRRATIAAMAKKVARLTWKIETAKNETVLTLGADGVKAATLCVREPLFTAGRKLTVKAKGKTVLSEILTADPRTMLSEARRTGERLAPVARTLAIVF
jgi:hypothetical protein